MPSLKNIKDLEQKYRDHHKSQYSVSSASLALDSAKTISD